MGGGIFNSLSDEAIRRLDALSLGAVFATYVGWLPHIAAGMSIIWVGLRIAVTIQEYRLNKRKLDA